MVPPLESPTRAALDPLQHVAMASMTLSIKAMVAPLGDLITLVTLSLLPTTCLYVTLAPNAPISSLHKGLKNSLDTSSAEKMLLLLWVTIYTEIKIIIKTQERKMSVFVSNYTSMCARVAVTSLGFLLV